MMRYVRQKGRELTILTQKYEHNVEKYILLLQNIILLVYFNRLTMYHVIYS